ncbi:MAG: hypothetical protein GXY08_10460 [Ruminococcus sp.]|nr:hypothetical protein [Ruminococcus sp.]
MIFKRTAALAASLLLAGTVFGCSEYDDGSSEGSENTSVKNTVVVTTPLNPTPEEKTTEATEPTTAADVKVDPVTVKNDTYLPSMVGMKVSELSALMDGEFELDIDYLPGIYAMYNDEIFPNVKFYFIDKSQNDLIGERDNFPNVKDELEKLLADSSSTIEKINIYAGGAAVDDFRVGMTYKECSNFLGDFPVSGGDLGEYFCGAPASVFYGYMNREYNADIELHFNLSGQINRDINEGKIFRDGFIDIQAKDMVKYDPELEVICIKDLGSSDLHPSATASSVLDPIKDGGKTHTYGAENLFDGDLSTCWCEGKEGTGKGEYIDISLSGESGSGYLAIYNGLLTNSDTFYKNCRPSEIQIETDGEYPMNTKFCLSTSYIPKYPRCILIGLTGVTKLRITAIEVEKGEKYDDMTISEIVLK